jgi:uncharacterized membrane protein YoaK (UPF0700 family)
MNLIVPVLLSINGGYVDTATFLALQGLFAAHVTGNFVTLGAALVLGTSGVLAKLLALPVFCLVIAAVRLLGFALAVRGLPQLRLLLGLKVLLLLAGLVLAVRLGPFPDGDSWRAIVTGMVLVSAMAVQNAVQRVHLASAPPTTMMSGNTTQIMMDLMDLAQGVASEQVAATRARLRRMVGVVSAFAAGCAAAALLFAVMGVWCFVVPPVIAGTAALVRVQPAPRP